MDFIDPILSVASQIYTLVENVKANKKRCQRVSHRVKTLEELVRSIKQREQGQTSADIEKALKELSITLKSAQELIKKYTLANWVERILNSSSHGDEFNTVNERLNDAFQVLSGALQVDQGNMLYQVFELTSREKEDEVDRREDDTELKRLLLDYMKSQQEKTDAMLREFQHVKNNVETVVEILNKPSITNEVIRMIKSDELKYEHPKVPFMTTSTSEVYRGEYHGFSVAIKRYIDPVNTCAREVRSVFNKEVETMKRFESPNILRMFGICVQDENGPSPQFLIIMEYCEKGSLRQVLDSECKLSWTRKACMCLDAAKGLYRLHQTEEKSKVHGCINSSKFLVAKGYTVKLGGFELAKTETSLKKSTKDKDIRSLCYSPPQMLNNINHVYSKECEIYSFGIVLWEVATRKRPFEGWSNQEIYQKVCKEKFQEPLPDDCPEPLEHLINTCRAYDSFQRPSAGVLVDKLRSMVAQLEEQ
ncbi:mixed lineage kinase domain-like protein [Chelmon rostratus]|uniref:mixed lineage kinase domain-like protein n=1 Tax=Chelmon rostratus TaxID=109905 RepID=UPI001BE54A3B|nr:mixed lineage kinase domain-like protein [Chelmon rostratus]XP_041795372.1 mixed lineage kinase domain-like protein [Chelmon rostratus]